MTRSSSTSSSRLWLKLAVLFTPLLGLAAVYAALDPFRVLRHYERYYAEPTPVTLDRDFVSTQQLLQSHGVERWDSFVFGSSRSLAFITTDWAAHLPPGAKPYHFDATGESLYGVASKVRLLRERGIPFKNALIVLDPGLLHQATSETSYLHIKHPAVTGQSEWAFQAHFFRAWFFEFFALKFVHYKIIGKVRPYMRGVLDTRVLTRTWPGNDTLYTGPEREIAERGVDAYVAARPPMQARQSPGVAPAAIGKAQLTLLRRLAADLEGVDVRIVVGPTFDRQSLAPSDAKQLSQLFHRLYDYSGDNAVTADARNYYDDSHFNVNVARCILADVYSDRPLPDATPRAALAFDHCPGIGKRDEQARR